MPHNSGPKCRAFKKAVDIDVDAEVDIIVFLAV